MKQKNILLSVVFILVLTLSSVGVYAETPDSPEAILDVIEHLQLPSGDLEEEAIIEALAIEGVDARAGEFAYVYNFADFKDALANPNVGIVLLLNDISLEEELVIDRDLSVSGVMGSTITTNGYYLRVQSSDDVSLLFSNVVLDGQQQDGGIHVTSSVHIKGLTIENCKGTFGAITNATHIQSRMESDMGTYIVETPYKFELIVEDCILRNNTAVYGGGIHIGGTSTVIKNCEISGNYASSSGGGIYTNTTLTTIENSQITNNVAGSSGGGISSAAINSYAIHTVIIENSDIMYNQANFGGGLSLGSVNNTLINTNVSHNTATSGGGVHISTLREPLSITGGTYENNIAEQGGAFWLYPAHATNLAGEIAQYGYIELSDMIIKDNVATEDGGGIFINLRPSALAGNRYRRVEISEDVIFSGNTAAKGYYMTDEEDIAIYEAQVHATQLSSPFTQYAYNNFDISYTKGTMLEAVHVNFFLRHSDTEADTVVTLYVGQTLGDNLPDGPVVSGLLFVGWTDGDGAFYDKDIIITEAVSLYPAYIPE